MKHIKLILAACFALAGYSQAQADSAFQSFGTVAGSRNGSKTNNCQQFVTHPGAAQLYPDGSSSRWFPSEPGAWRGIAVRDSGPDVFIMVMRQRDFAIVACGVNVVEWEVDEDGEDYTVLIYYPYGFFKPANGTTDGLWVLFQTSPP